MRSDLDAILQIYAHAREAMAAAGNPSQWGKAYPPPLLVERDILANRQFVTLENGRLTGTFAFILGAEPTYAVIDGAWLDDTLPYGTLHRLAAAGGGGHLADQILAWALERCASLRVDTHADNRAMQHILQKNGFCRCGIIRVEDGTARLAYQKLKA